MKKTLTGLLFAGLSVLPGLSKAQEHPIRYKTTITKEVQKNLVYLYKDKDIEFPFCLMGEKTEKPGALHVNYHIKELKIPNVSIADTSISISDWSVCKDKGPSVNGIRLKKNRYLGLVHNHPHSNPEDLQRINGGDLYRFMKDEDAEIEVIVTNWKDVNENSHLISSIYYKEKIIKQIGDGPEGLSKLIQQIRKDN